MTCKAPFQKKSDSRFFSIHKIYRVQYAQDTSSGVTRPATLQLTCNVGLPAAPHVLHNCYDKQPWQGCMAWCEEGYSGIETTFLCIEDQSCSMIQTPANLNHHGPGKELGMPSKHRKHPPQPVLNNCYKYPKIQKNARTIVFEGRRLSAFRTSVVWEFQAKLVSSLRMAALDSAPARVAWQAVPRAWQASDRTFWTLRL